MSQRGTVSATVWHWDRPAWGIFDNATGTLARFQTQMPIFWTRGEAMQFLTSRGWKVGKRGTFQIGRVHIAVRTA